jgi:superfamily I DNA/RNA helicase
MIPNATLVLGPPGCGKTTYLVSKIKKALQEGAHPSRIAVISFTRKAIEEMVNRACAEVNLSPKDFPHIRTSHSTGYHALGMQARDVMSTADYKEIGGMIGLTFEGRDSRDMDEGSIMNTMSGSGSQYLSIIDRARNKRISLEQEYNITADHGLHYAKLLQVYNQIQEYKSNKTKFDFVDMIEKYIEIVEPPSLDYLFVDEAQDFTPLQWEMVKLMATKATNVLIAGDDDQAIHRWTGVDVEVFKKSAKDVMVLDQSYRIPRAVHSLAGKIAQRIEGRLPKVFKAREEEGVVEYVNHLDDIDFDEGQFIVMARVNSYVRELASFFETNGYKYEIKGRSSIPEKLAENIYLWNELTQQKKVGVQRVKHFYDAVPKQGQNAVVKRGSRQQLEALGPDAMVDIHELTRDYGLLAGIEDDAYDVLRVSTDMRNYINAIERRGESLTSPPRIKLSTFHAMKGGEGDNCVVYLGSTFACVNSDHPDDEHRAFYVGITRAKQKLYLLNSDKKYRYEI